MKRLRLSLSPLVRPSLLILAGIFIIGFLLFFRLNSLVPGLSANEITARNSSSSLHLILTDPINLPYKAGVYALLKLHYSSGFALRGVSALIGLATLGLFYNILRRWQNIRIALFGTSLFMTSSWFLHQARTGSPEILLFGLLAMVTAGLWLRQGHWQKFALFACIVILASCLYVPGLLWFALLGIIWRRQAIIDELRRIPWWVILSGVVLFIALIAPLGIAMYRQHDLALTMLGLPSHLPSLSALGKNLINIPLFLFIHGPTQPEHWLAHTPVLDVFSIAMLVLGIYADTRYRQLDRATLLLGILVVGVILIAIGGPVTLTLLIPFIYLLIATGITYLLYEWFSVFPLNPIARGVGVGVLVMALVATSAYQLDRYFVAWPHSPATKAVFNQKP